MLFNWLNHYDLILLDFDGLLVDTERLHYKAYVLMCERRGLHLTWTFAEFCEIAHRSSDGIRNALYATFPSLIEDEPDWLSLYKEKKKIYLNLLNEGELRLMEGVESFLSALKTLGKKHCVVTNSAREQIECIREHLAALQSIPLWITREDYNLPKPNPDGYIKAMSLLKSPGDRVIGFEDSPRGVEALIAAGSKAVMVGPVVSLDKAFLENQGVKCFNSFNTISRDPYELPIDDFVQK